MSTLEPTEAQLEAVCAAMEAADNSCHVGTEAGRAAFALVRDMVLDGIADRMANSNHEAEDFAEYVRAMKGTP